MHGRLKQFLETLAGTRGQKSYAPASNGEEDLRSFQDEVDEIEKLAGEGSLNVIGKPHRESRTGKQYIDRIRVELTTAGIKSFAKQNSDPPIGKAPSTRTFPINERLMQLKQDFNNQVLLPLRSDLRIQGMNAYEAWKKEFLEFLEQHLPHEVNHFRQLTSHSGTGGQSQKENAYNRFMREDGKTCLTFLETLVEKTPTATRTAKVFLSYAREDYAATLQLYRELSAEGLDVWLDTESLLPGQNWKATIRREIRECRYFIAVLSHNSVSKKGYVQKELKEALDVLEEYPTSSVFIIPARLDDCVPSDDRLRDLHWVNMFENWDVGVKRILKTMEDSSPSVTAQLRTPPA